MHARVYAHVGQGVIARVAFNEQPRVFWHPIDY